MSQAALALAVRDRLRSVLTLRDGECEFMAGPEPPPVAGRVFYAVHEGGFNPGDPVQLGLSERHSIVVDVSVRVDGFPMDRWGPHKLAEQSRGLDALCRQVILAIHFKYEVLTLANAYIDDWAGSPRNGFIEPLFFLGCGPAQKQGPDWFGAAAESAIPAVGLSRTVSFGQAHRVQNLETIS